MNIEQQQQNEYKDKVIKSINKWLFNKIKYIFEYICLYIYLKQEKICKIYIYFRTIKNNDYKLNAWMVGLVNKFLICCFFVIFKMLSLFIF